MNTSTPSTKRPQKISTDALFSRIQVEDSFKAKAYAALKEAILKMDLYGNPEPIMLDERELSDRLGVSRTPVREAVAMLEQDGFLRTVPRRGILVVKKNKREIIEMVQANRINLVMTVIVIGSLIASMVFSFLGIARPMTRLNGALGEMAGGNLDVVAVGCSRSAVRERRLADAPSHRRRADGGDGREVEHQPALERRPERAVAVRAVDVPDAARPIVVDAKEQRRETLRRGRIEEVAVDPLQDVGRP